MWMTAQERAGLLVLGSLALAAMGVLAWQQARPPLALERGPVPSAQWDALLQQARRVRLNAATAEELERLPDIGPATARRIVDYRQAHGPFRRVEELEAVAGIGPKTIGTIRGYLTVEDE